MLEFTEKFREELVQDIILILSRGLSESYAREIAEKIEDDVVEDVLVASAWSEGKRWNDDDVRLAISRVLLDRI